MTTEQIRLRLTDDETQVLRKIAARCGLQPTSLAAVFVRAAIHAIAENKDRVPMPLKFDITEAEAAYSLNETPTAYGKAKGKG